MEQYLNPNEQDDLKSMLYSYLKDKAQRRAGVTSKADYEGAEDQFAKQMQLRDVGALAGGLSEAASMVGQVQGKRAQSDIIPRTNQDLYASTQGAYENFRTLRDQEERSNMNDLRVADYLTDLDRKNFQEKQYNDLEPRRQLELKLMQKRIAQEPGTKRRLESRIAGPGGEPVLLDESGQPSTLPGYKLRETPQGGSLSIVPGYEAQGQVLMKDKAGNFVSRPLPKGFEPKKKTGETDDGKRMSESSTIKVSEAREAFAQADNVGQSMQRWRDMMGPIEGRLRSINPYDENAQKFDADLTKAAQVIGKYMEGGVLRAEDIPKYRKMLPSLSDTPNVGEYKLDQVKKMLSEKQSRDIQALKSQGYKTEGLDIKESGDGKIRVRNKQTGQTGKISPQYLDPEKYEVIP